MMTLGQHDRRALWLAAAFAVLLAIAFALVLPTEPQETPVSPPADPEPQSFRVCADPNNLPFTNVRGEGFENKIAELLAADLHERLEYTWWRQTRSFFRNTLAADRCDVVLGIPASGFPKALATQPYYTSTYVFVTKKGSGTRVTSLDDPALRRLRIGLHLINDDDETPAAQALERRGLDHNIRWYHIYGADFRQPNPPAQILDAVAHGEVDVAIVWGPLAGYFARERDLELTPVRPQVDAPATPFVYSIAMGVRKSDAARKAALDAAIGRNRARIEQILDQYGVPRVGKEPAA
jgi:mxaJ protein